MELRQGRGSWGWGKGSAPEGGGHGTACPGQWAWPQVPEFKEHLDSTQLYGVIFELSCVEPRVGLSDPHGFLPTQLRKFYDSVITGSHSLLSDSHCQLRGREVHIYLLL